MAGKEESYGLDPSFERAVARLCASSPKFFGSVGHEIEPEALEDDTARLIIKACKVIMKSSGRGPTHPSVLLQRLRRLNEEGSVSKKQVLSVLDLLIEADDITDVEAREELVPVLRRRLDAEIVKSTVDAYSSRKGMERIIPKIERSQRIGVVDSSVGLRLGQDSFAEIDRVRRVHRMPLGIPELDAVLRGGPPRGTASMFIAGPGGGKSMQLSHTVATNLRYGMFCCYASLELPVTEIMARTKANLTGVPTEVIVSGDFDAARTELQAMHPTLGTLVVQHFSPKTTTFADIAAWVRECEDAEGYAVDCLVIDYIDKLGARNTKDNEYITQGAQTEDFRVFCEDNGKWGLTGSQAAIKGKDPRKRIGLGDVRDSTRKVDVADLVITLNKSAGGDMIEYFIGKNRYGVSDVSVGPLPHDWASGRMVVM